MRRNGEKHCQPLEAGRLYHDGVILTCQAYAGNPGRLPQRRTMRGAFSIYFGFMWRGPAGPRCGEGTPAESGPVDMRTAAGCSRAATGGTPIAEDNGNMAK